MTEPERAKLPLKTLALLFAHDAWQEGVVEHSNNWGPQVSGYLKSAGIERPAPWCAAYVNDMAERAADMKGVRSPLEEVPLQAYVPSYVQTGRDRGWVVEPEDVELGDLFCLYLPTKGRYAHMGFVRGAFPAEGRYLTLEGNTNDGGGRDGYKVAARRRRIGRHVLFLSWDEESE